MEKFLVIKDLQRTVKRFNIKGKSVQFKIKPIPKDENPIVWIKDAVTQVINKVTEDVHADDKIGFSFCSKDFNKGGGWLNFQDADKVTFEEVWVLNKIFQSNSTGLNTDTFCLEATTVRLPKGRGIWKPFVDRRINHC